MRVRFIHQITIFVGLVFALILVDVLALGRRWAKAVGITLGVVDGRVILVVVLGLAVALSAALGGAGGG